MVGKSLVFSKNSMSSDSFVSIEFLSQKLLGIGMDLVQALDSVKDCMYVLQMYRNACTFKRLFEIAEQSIKERFKP